MFTWIILIAIVILALILIDREIYFYEGTHLSPRVQAWLYDRWAEKYDTGKKESQLRDAQFLAKPLMDALVNIPEPFILDVATGTGRLPLALTNEADFKGHIIAVDISQGMLLKAVGKVENEKERVTFMCYEKFPLPFPDGSFDAIACLEALEVMPEMKTPLAEIARLLCPGGILLSSRGTEASGRKAKVVGVDAFKDLLREAGFIEVEVTPWWKIFDRVFARKPGEPTPAAYKTIFDVLLCPNCGQNKIHPQSSDKLSCAQCNHTMDIDENGIILYKK